MPKELSPEEHAARFDQERSGAADRLSDIEQNPATTSLGEIDQAERRAYEIGKITSSARTAYKLRNPDKFPSGSGSGGRGNGM